MNGPKKCRSCAILATFLVFVSSFAQIDAQNNKVTKSLLRDKANRSGHARFVRHENTKLNLTAVSKSYVNTAGHCAYNCAKSSDGFSFNFVTTPDTYGRHLCEIFTTDKYRSQDSFICQSGVNHYSIASSCSSFPCRNGGTCSPNYEEEKHICLCHYGFTGQQCETPIDHIRDYALIGYSYKTLTTTSMKDCLIACNDDCPCNAYQRSGDLCELMNKVRSQAPAQFVAKAGSEYNERKQRYMPENTPRGCSSTCKNDCCASSPCLNGGTCVEDCSNPLQRYSCLCRRGFGGMLCEKPMTCAAHGRQSSSGLYRILTISGQEINVYCDFTSTPGIVWSLIESFLFQNHLEFQNKPFPLIYTVNEASMNWQRYRQSYYTMLETRYNATLWRATCNYNAGYATRDSIRGSLMYLDIMTHSTGYLCVPVDFIDARGTTCSSCTVAMYQDTTLHVSVDSNSGLRGCQWDGRSGANSKKIKGKWYYDTYFGNYFVYNIAFSCSSSLGSTTQWWLGTPV